MTSLVEMVGSTVVQEVVSGAVSLALPSGAEKASQGHLMERLKMAHSELASALERSGKMPIFQASFLSRRTMFKLALQECHDMLYKHKLREDEGAPSLFKKIRSVLPFFSTRKDLLSSPDVARFEWFVEKAKEFVKDLETCCSIAHYRLYLNPLITHLLQGSTLWYHMVQGCETRGLLIEVSRSEEHGFVASLSFNYHHRKKPMKSVYFTLTLRLSESTDIVGIAAKCLQSLGPRFACLAELSTGEVAQISTQLQVGHRPERDALALLGRICRQDPLCCTAIDPCANKVVSSELTHRFPEPVITMRFDCHISASLNKLQRSANGAWPPLRFTATFTPHCSNLFLSDRSLQEVEEAIQTEAIDCFIRQSEQTEYKMYWFSAHGGASFTVSKPVTEIGGPKTRIALKRKR